MKAISVDRHYKQAHLLLLGFFQDRLLEQKLSVSFEIQQSSLLHYHSQLELHVAGSVRDVLHKV